jgi:hypothetical protein
MYGRCHNGAENPTRIVFLHHYVQIQAQITSLPPRRNNLFGNERYNPAKKSHPPGMHGPKEVSANLPSRQLRENRN